MRKRFFIPLMLLLIFAMLLGCRYSVQGGLNLFMAVPVSKADPGDADMHGDHDGCCGEYILADMDPQETESITPTAPPVTTQETDCESLMGSDITKGSYGSPMTTATHQLSEKEVETSQSQKTTSQSTGKETSSNKKATTTSKARPTTQPSSQKTTTTSSQKTTAKVEGSYYPSYEEEVVRLLNAERAKEGLAPLKMDSSLRSSARIRAKEIIACWGHTRPNGQRFCTSIKLSYSKVAENIAAGQETPEGVVKAWMDSASHRANIMNPSFKSIGVGCYYDSSTSYKIYWSQLFLNP